MTEFTYTSPFVRSTDPEKMASWPLAQHKMVSDAFQKFMEAPFEANIDLRGRTFEVLVHDTGLDVTIREV